MCLVQNPMPEGQADLPAPGCVRFRSTTDRGMRTAAPIYHGLGRARPRLLYELAKGGRRALRARLPRVADARPRAETENQAANRVKWMRISILRIPAIIDPRQGRTAGLAANIVTGRDLSATAFFTNHYEWGRPQRRSALKMGRAMVRTFSLSLADLGKKNRGG